MFVNNVQRSKKEVFREKRERMLTGGGPPPPPVDSTTQKIYDLIPEQFEPLNNIFDDDQCLSQAAPTTSSQLDEETEEVLSMCCK